MSSHNRRFVWVTLYYLPFLIACGVIFWFSSMSHPPIPRFMIFSFGDKVLHALAFMGVGIAAAFGATLRRRQINYFAYIEAWGLTLCYALADEFHQSFTPQRTSSGADWVADAFGAALGIALYFAALNRYRHWANSRS